MTREPAALVPVTDHGLWTRAALGCIGAVLGASLLVSPRPAVWLVRTQFARGGAEFSRKLARHAPSGVVASLDERYGDGDGAMLDIYRPADAGGPLPLVVWVHGGGWVGGSKDELAGYFELLASHGYAVAAPDYSLAPAARYPTPLRQIMQALDHLQRNAERLQIDPRRIVLAGDSAGAQIAAQIAALATTPGYAATVGVDATVTAEQLRGIVLACGPYAIEPARHAATPIGRHIITAVLWAYSGTRDFFDDPHFATMAVADHLSPAFPPTLITVGNADPLRPHTEQLLGRLRSHGLAPETVLFPDDHEPPLGHEYQFDLDQEAAQQFLDRLRRFLQRVCSSA